MADPPEICEWEQAVQDRDIAAKEYANVLRQENRLTRDLRNEQSTLNGMRDRKGCFKESIIRDHAEIVESIRKSVADVQAARHEHQKRAEETEQRASEAMQKLADLAKTVHTSFHKDGPYTMTREQLDRWEANRAALHGDHTAQVVARRLLGERTTGR